MPTVTQKPVQGYAHCRTAMCPGYHQEQIDALEETQAWTIGEKGGDGAFAQLVENTMIEFRFADEKDAPCPSCGERREVTGQPRKQYQPLSGYDPMYLAHNGANFDASKKVDTADQKRIAELEAKLAQLLDALEGDK